MVYFCPSFLSYLIVSLMILLLSSFFLSVFFLFDSYDSLSNVAGSIPYIRISKDQAEPRNEYFYTCRVATIVQI
ncbi:hypothetical protein BDV23DRAFT_162681 [Aspergillus alliaceus]|uniref:Uncharacterized protein n=1 Tax=Petromyces alliaceus TaxID=209559 RepID=A0A5N7BY08_PETAA|nr:hypothetical protein BDV23DRAFT_162681 [Aspergillus alliaceus]